jgi:hypothetical protein
MDACTRNGLYEQAVDIVAFTNTLERRHLLLAPSSSSSPTRPRAASSSSYSTPQQQQALQGHALVISGLVQELRVLQRQLRERLLQQLRRPIQLPRCLQVHIRGVDNYRITHHDPCARQPPYRSPPLSYTTRRN